MTIGKICIIAAALAAWSLPLAAQEHAAPRRSDRSAAPHAAAAAAPAPADIATLRDQLLNGLTAAQRAAAEAAATEAHAELSKDTTVTLLGRQWYLALQLRRMDQRVRLLAAEKLAERDTEQTRAILAEAATAGSVPERVRETLAKHLSGR